MKPELSAFAHALNRLLREKNLTQNEFAKILGVSSNSINTVCQGKSFPLQSLELIYRIFNLRVTLLSPEQEKWLEAASHNELLREELKAKTLEHEIAMKALFTVQERITKLLEKHPNLLEDA